MAIAFGFTGRKSILRSCTAGPMLAAVVVALALAACARAPQPQKDAFSSIAESVIGAGYTHISERYVEPVLMSDVALAGIEAVDKIDAKLHVTRDHDRIRLIDGQTVVKDFPAPKNEDPESWAELTTQVLESGRGVSKNLHDSGLERIYEVVFDGALAKLDRFSRYSPAAVAREQRAQRDGFSGIGITLKDEGNEILVVSVIEDSPAAKKGVQPGDVILAVEGEIVKGWTLPQVVERLRGPINGAVHVRFGRGQDRAPFDLALYRALIIPPTVSFAAHGDVAYIKISSFNQNTTASLDRALRQASREMGASMRGVVIDLRGNPGGLLDQAVTVSDLFLTHGRILSTAGRHPDSNQIFDAAGSDRLHGMPVALLVNGSTASAAEVVAAALQDQGRAVVIGTSSYGKGTVQTVHRLPNDGEIIITWSRILAPSGYTLNHVGVIPNICTSKVEGDGQDAAMQLLDQVRTGRLDTAAARATLLTNHQPGKAEIRLLRSSCPPKPSDGELDLDVAQRVIEDGSLFARMLQPASSAEIAKSP